MSRNCEGMGVSENGSRGGSSASLSDLNESEAILDDTLRADTMPGLAKLKPFVVGGKKKAAWYSALMSTYKTRHEEFKRIFKDVPRSERLVVDYSCALQKNILVQGRMYISQHWLCFYANIFSVETSLMIQFKDIAQITKEKTALVFSNAIQIATSDGEKYFISSLTSRDKTYLILCHLWQNSVVEQAMTEDELWIMIHYCYGDDLGLSDEDREEYVEPCQEARDTFKERIETNPSSPGKSDSADDNKDADAKLPEQSPLEGEELLADNQSISASQTVSSAPPFCSQHDHLQIGVVDEVVQLDVDSLFTQCLTDSPVYQRFALVKRTTNVVHEDWPDTADTDGNKARNVSYTLSITYPVGPKSAPTSEKQTMLACSRVGKCYLVDSQCVSSSLPYGENFFIVNRYCMSRVSDSSSRLRVTSRIQYRKNVWGIVKAIIDKNATAGYSSHLAF